ncbi:hypothetical protein P12x_000569 [Tundrisphaera lichenicola]|uniref:hypothetical protein n=1 Tax=Tundrisphaera lichenicola TaxID=2029860 RepID=UPI003EB81837
MRLPHVRFTVWKLMVAVAAVATLLALALAIGYEGRPDIHRLVAGREVVISAPHLTEPSGAGVAMGTRVIVAADDQDDESYRSERREVIVTLPSGNHLSVRREDLRPVSWGD